MIRTTLNRAQAIRLALKTLAEGVVPWADMEEKRAQDKLNVIDSALLDVEAAILWKRPRIVCLCGSTKFKQQFIEANFRETMAGAIVLTVGWFGHTDAEVYTPSDEEKYQLDELHKRKIDLADEILVINVGGYVGPSTRSEIEYARRVGKKIRWLEDPVKAWIDESVNAEEDA